jgi:hypothetical protein
MILKVEPERIDDKRGGAGSASKPDPDSRHKHSPKPESQGVC